MEIKKIVNKIKKNQKPEINKKHFPACHSFCNSLLTKYTNRQNIFCFNRCDLPCNFKKLHEIIS